MSGFLFEEVIFGPVRSRRLGLSLGINLLPLHSKYCSFNCIYCECGWTKPDQQRQPEFPSRSEVAVFLEDRIRQLIREQHIPDVITYAGNGEPTLHPEFAGIVDDTIALRDRYIPGTKVSVLSNSSMIGYEPVFTALKKIDNNILKLDAGSQKLFNLINNPAEPILLETLVENLARFHGDVIIQSMFLRGKFRGELVDNTTAEEVEQWIKRLKKINPRMVMSYPIARETPLNTLEKILLPEMEKIAAKARESGLNVQVYQ